MKTHEELVTDEVIERYVRGRLGDEERQGFEEHFLDCDECSERVEEMQRFVSGIRYASQAGLLDPFDTSESVPARPFSLSALAFGLATAFVAVAGVWIWSLRASNETLVRRNQALVGQLASARSEVTDVAQRTTPTPGSPLPFAILDASRTAAGPTLVTVGTASGQFALWIQVDAVATSKPLDLQISGSNGAVIETLAQLQENQSGALTIALSSAAYPPGVYSVRVFRDDHQLAREYRVEVVGK